MADRFPWFPFYAADWRLSRSVRAMTPEQRGGYVELLCVAWDDGMAEPSLPTDDASLAKLSELGPKRWAKVGPAIRACFIERDGRIYNERLSHVWEVQHARYQLRSIAGKMGGKAKAQAKQKAGNATNLLPQKSDAEVDRTKNSSGAAPLAALVGSVAARAVRA
jgi:uncharacterized protein YdaU (DUF1376 family)